MLNNTCFILFFMSFHLGVSATPSVARACLTIDDKLSNIQSQMRAGYSAKQGEKLRKKERALIKKREECKKKKYPLVTK